MIPISSKEEKKRRSLWMAWPVLHALGINLSVEGRIIVYRDAECRRWTCRSTTIDGIDRAVSRVYASLIGKFPQCGSILRFEGEVKKPSSISFWR